MRKRLVISVLTICLIATSAACGGAGAGSKPGAKDGAAPAVKVDGDTNAGKQLFSTKGCIACHTAAGVPGATGSIGPNLNGLGDPGKRPSLTDGAPNTPENIKAWIQDPGKRKPGTMMPNLNLSEKEATDLTAFMVTLR
ncbi:MAG: cytochrome c [Chloroflexota bacterium]